MIAFDQTGEINRRAMALGYYLRQERERTIVRAVIDADASSGKYVYRPNGSGQQLYKTNGSHRNYIGAGNTTSAGFNTAVTLTDWTDIEAALHYRATEIVDDRIDGERDRLSSPLDSFLSPRRSVGLLAAS
ncbi:MAG: hypothetical protein R3B91_00105 [Planctomycetaceae bacterium]